MLMRAIPPIPRHLRGASLIVALVLLLTVTLIGLAGMRTTQLDMKMAASARDRSLAFEAAEATLKQVEANLFNPANAYPLDTITTRFSANCTGNATNENQGLCFQGVMDSSDPYKSCQVIAPGSLGVNLWEEQALWKNTARYKTLPIAVAPNTPPVNTRYIIEFMCFAIKDRALLGRRDDRDNGDQSLIFAPMFRISTLAEGPGRRSRVMLQSTVKVPTT